LGLLYSINTYNTDSRSLWLSTVNIYTIQEQQCHDKNEKLRQSAMSTSQLKKQVQFVGFIKLCGLKP